MAETNNSQKPRNVRGALEQVLHFWPLLIFVFGGLVVISSTLGQVYVSDIATKVHNNLKVADPAEFNGIKTDIATIKTTLGAQTTAHIEMVSKLNTIENRLDTLIRIQLENQ